MNTSYRSDVPQAVVQNVDPPSIALPPEPQRSHIVVHLVFPRLSDIWLPKWKHIRNTLLAMVGALVVVGGSYLSYSGYRKWQIAEVERKFDERWRLQRIESDRLEAEFRARRR